MQYIRREDAVDEIISTLNGIAFNEECRCKREYAIEILRKLRKDIEALEVKEMDK